jgi:exopolysaccharide production negative regulator
MRIFKLLSGLVLVVLAPALAAAETPFASTREALKQGISAYQGGYYEIAIPALEYAARQDEFMAQFYLARIYSDNNGSRTDHGKAYELFERIADEHLDVDPDDDPRAPYVGKALTALAGYVHRGLPEIGLRADPERAVFYLKNASTTFGDEDAQFELAKLQLNGDGLETNIPLGRHWLSILSRNGHAGAQAFFADLLWRGKYVGADPVRALALISIAVNNAPQHERLWIEDIYQNIFCGAAEGTRKQATGIVAEWGHRFGRKPEARSRSGLAFLTASPIRTCANGEPVGPILDLRSRTEPEVAPATKGVTASAEPKVRSFTYGTAAPPRLRGVGADVSVTAPSLQPR